MKNQYANIVINYSKELKSIGNKISKEIKRFVNKYQKILVLDLQKIIEVNLFNSEKLDISITNRVINVHLFSRVNIGEITMLIENKVINILEKDKVFVPDYIKEQVNNCFSLQKKIKLNEIETNKIILDIDKNNNN